MHSCLFISKKLQLYGGKYANLRLNLLDDGTAKRDYTAKSA